MMRIIRILVIASLGVSCVGTDVGNPPDDRRRVSASLEFATYLPQDPGAILVAGDVDVDAVWLNIAEILVTPADDCRRPAARTIEGPFVVNLLAGEVYPEPPLLAEEASEFCEIELTYAPAAEVPEAAPAELEGRAVWVEASRSSGDFTVSLTRERRLKYDGQTFVVDGDDGDEVAFINAFDPTNWFRELPAGANVDDSSSQAEAAQFWNAFRQASRVAPDRNGNRAVDEGEFDAPVGVPSDDP